MRWCLPFAVLLGLSITDAVSHAQGQGAAERLAAQRPPAAYVGHRDAGYFAPAGVVRFQLAQGRLRLDAPRHRKGSQSRKQNDVYESITVTAARGIPSLHYVCQTPQQHLTVSVERAVDVRIESWLPKTGERAVLSQPEQGAITWTLSRGDLNEEYSGATLLHIRQSDPAGFDLHCGPLVQCLLRGRSLRSVSELTEAALLAQLIDLDATQQIDTAGVLACVEQLRSPKQSKRRAAERRLLKWGTPIIPIINSIPDGQLDAEQTDRLRVVFCRLRSQEDDTAASLATMLINDRDHWQRVAAQLSKVQLSQANAYLNRVGLSPLDLGVEPAARIARGSR